MSIRLYYTDAYRRAFTAQVLQTLSHEGRPAVRLDRTAFYPTSGGQPFDTGRIGHCQVVDVVDDEAGVLHVLDGMLAEGETVDAAVDWERRFDHMQQHTGQHILSAAFNRLSENPTVGFHMGTETSTIDLAREATADEIGAAEMEANRIVWTDAPVSVRFVTPEEVQRLALRKEPARGGVLRLIDIDGFDLSACGGTHVRSTGGVGIVAVTGSERFRGGSRITFACGLRALLSHRALRTAVAESVRVLSVLPAELGPSIERLQADARAQSRVVKQLREALSAHEARSLLDAAPVVGGVRLVVQVIDGADAGLLKTMAAAVTAAPRAAAVLFTSTLPAQVVVARSTDVTLDASALLKDLVRTYGGRGGGSAALAQGGGLTGDLRQVSWTATGLLEAEFGRG
jgi:alanyl-tRNA synthetase